MKKIVLSICLLLLTIPIFATDVSGNQSGNWNLASSPYNIIGEITIPANETLEIEAGVEIIAMGNYKITALGNILAIGTLNDTIRFYGNGGLNWGGLRLEDEETTSQFDYCRISNTDDTNDYGIQSINSPVSINHSFLDDHQKAISFSALSSNNPSYMEIKNSKIAFVQKSGITITDNSNVLIDSCEVTRCGLGTSFYGAIQLSLQSNSHSCSPTITNNYIHHNDKQGVTLANLFGYDNMAPIVEYNEISYNYTGLYLYVGKGTYKGNHIHHNFVENNPDSGAGVMLYGNGADAIFTYNEVNNNYTGFYLTNEATVNLGDLNNTSTNDDGYNCIYDNIFYTGEEYSVYNASSMDITAENTVWDDDPPIDVTIIDGNDNPAYGIVDYEPTLSPFAPADYINIDLENYTISPGLIAYPTYAELSSWNLYRDGILMGMFMSPYTFIPIYGQETNYWISINYDNPVGESTIIDTTIFIPHILNPPQNLAVEIYPNVVFSWDPPEPGSTSPPDPLGHYSVFLDGCFIEVTNEQFWIFTDLLVGETYLAEVCANYEAGSSELVGFEFIIQGVPPSPPNNVVLNPNIGVLFWEDPQDPQFTLIGFNIFLDGDFIENVGIDVFEYCYAGLVPGVDYVAGVSAVYEEGESEIVEAGFWIPHICNPPTDASYEIIDDYVHLTWEEPEPGSSHPFLNYRIYLNGELLEETTELSYDITDLIIGQTYLVGLTAFYEYLFESNPIEFEITFTEVDQGNIQPITALYQNYPNPFNPSTTISFSVTQNSDFVNLVIYNLKGQKVKTFSPSLCHPELVEGRGQNRYNVVWNGTDQTNKPVSSGVYFYKLVSDGKNIASKKMLLLK